MCKHWFTVTHSVFYCTEYIKPTRISCKHETFLIGRRRLSQPEQRNKITQQQTVNFCLVRHSRNVWRAVLSNRTKYASCLTQQQPVHFYHLLQALCQHHGNTRREFFPKKPTKKLNKIKCKHAWSLTLAHKYKQNQQHNDILQLTYYCTW